jgi:hypothetical protein
MIYEIDKFTDYLVKLQLTANQFFILWLIDNKDIKNLEKYIKGIGKFDSEDMITLVDKGYLVNTNPNSSSFDLYSLAVTLEFKEMVIEPEHAYDELLDVYPRYVEVQGKKWPSTGLTFSEESMARDAYSKVIKKNRLLHIKILGLIKEWKEVIGESAPFKVDKFITGKYWLELEESKIKNVKPRIY